MESDMDVVDFFDRVRWVAPGAADGTPFAFVSYDPGFEEMRSEICSVLRRSDKHVLVFNDVPTDRRRLSWDSGTLSALVHPFTNGVVGVQSELCV